MLADIVDAVDFSACFAAERKPLIWFVRSLGCTDADLAADIAQTAFVRAYPIWDTIRYPKAWLRKVARREYARRCHAGTRDLPFDQAPAETAVVSAAAVVEQRATTTEYLAALASLPPKQREVMTWIVDGFANNEIAEALGESAETVRRNRSRAVSNLRRASRPWS